MFKDRSFLIKVVKDTPEGNKEVEVVDVVRSHFERHRTTYLIAAGIGVAGITWYITRSNVLPRGACVGSLPRGLSNTASPFSFGYKQTINVITVVEREGKGHPGWPVQCLETGQKWFTQGDAARAIGVSEGVMSGHIKGKLPDIFGLHFERINLGAQ